MKYSMSAKKTNSVHDISHTCNEFHVQWYAIRNGAMHRTSRHFSSSASGELLRTVSNIVTNDRSVVTSST